jgi:sodium/pantothenate symporter
MLTLVVGTAVAMMWRLGSPAELMRQATSVAPELGRVIDQPASSYIGYFVIWATAIPVIPHIVMRVFTARDADGARLSLNLAMLAYSVMILAAVLAIVPVGRVHFPGLEDADQVFLKVMEAEFPPLIRGVAVAAVLAAVMSTTDALLLACSSAVAHDILGGLLEKRASERLLSRIRIGSAWVIGLLALYWAISPPELISQFYTAGVGLLSASLFVPTIAGLWWKKANRLGGLASVVTGALTYILVFFGVVDIGVAPVVVALFVSGAAMVLCGWLGPSESAEMLTHIEALHAPAASRSERR